MENPIINILNEIKYIQYKYKYMVIGGGRLDLYKCKFYEVGNHPTANYGVGIDWLTKEFWDNFNKISVKFNAIIIDSGSEGYLPTYKDNNDIYVNHMIPAIMNKLNDNGVIIINNYVIRDANNQQQHIIDLLKQMVDKYKLKNNGNFMSKETGWGTIYGIYSKSDKIKLKNNHNIHNIKPSDFGKLHENGFIVFNDKYKSINEDNIIDFIINRIE